MRRNRGRGGTAGCGPALSDDYQASALNSVLAGNMAMADRRMRVLKHLRSGRFDAQGISELDPIEQRGNRAEKGRREFILVVGRQ